MIINNLLGQISTEADLHPIPADARTLPAKLCNNLKKCSQAGLTMTFIFTLMITLNN